MQAPAAPSQAPNQDDARAQIARLGLIFICSTSPRSIEFAKVKLRSLFGYDAEEDEIRAAAQALLAESSAQLMALLRPGRKS